MTTPCPKENLFPCPKCGTACKVTYREISVDAPKAHAIYTPIHPKELSVKDIAKLLPKGIAMCYQNIDIATRIHRAVYGGEK